MSGFQFIHYEKYKKDDIAGIIGEASRTPGYCPHVENVQAPTILRGNLEELQERLRHDVANYKKHSKDGKLKKIRDDANIMLAGVFSYPDATAKRGDPGLEKWLDLSMKFIASEYGDQLHTAVLHLDESHPHVHFYVIPRDYEMAAACRGDRASKETGKKLEAKKAMQSYQDDYFSQVSVQCGHTRLGPRRQRLTRAEWKGQQDYAMKIAAAESAVLDSAAQREVNAAKQEKANADAAALLAKEKRKALEAVEQANAAMREAKRLQAAATAKYDQAEALLAQYGLADVPPQPTPPQKGAEATPAGEFGL